jgi:hypothetical protein
LGQLNEASNTPPYSYAYALAPGSPFSNAKVDDKVHGMCSHYDTLESILEDHPSTKLLLNNYGTAKKHLHNLNFVMAFPVQGIVCLFRCQWIDGERKSPIYSCDP